MSEKVEERLSMLSRYIEDIKKQQQQQIELPEIKLECMI